MARFGGLGISLAGSAAAKSVGATLTGRKADWSDLIFTPGAARRFADELAHLRGAALKLGQLVSMDAGAMLPPEFSDVAARLRANADPMPPRQLRQVLETGWGKDWRSRFAQFEVRPAAAASIGQVHRAVTKDGRRLAIKVQYPGVRKSIDSDVDNVATLIKLSGLLPSGLDIKPLLAEAKQQLHEEADYRREAEHLDRYATAISGDDRFVIPSVETSLSGDTILAMDWLHGQGIETVAKQSASERQRVFEALLDLTLHELFSMKLMQTDPNYANFLYAGSAQPIGLIDFGAVRAIDESLSEAYRAVLRAGLGQDDHDLEEALIGLGVIATTTPEAFRAGTVALAREAFSYLDAPEFDFTDTSLAQTLREGGLALQKQGFNHAPPPPLMFIQRKLGGLFLLGARLEIRMDLRSWLERWA